MAVIRTGQKCREFKTLPVGGQLVELQVDIPRLQCRNCGSIRQVELEFADPKKHYTRSLAWYAVELCRVMTIKEVARHTGLSWDTVKEIHKEYLGKKYRHISLKNVRYIAIDEVYLGKARKFITTVVNLETGQVLHTGQGKGKELN